MCVCVCGVREGGAAEGTHTCRDLSLAEGR